MGLHVAESNDIPNEIAIQFDACIQYKKSPSLGPLVNDVKKWNFFFQINLLMLFSFWFKIEIIHVSLINMLVSLSSGIHFFLLIISTNFKVNFFLVSECSNQHLLIKSRKLKMEC